MKCEKCRFAPPVGAEGYSDECPHFETHGTIWKDGREGCTLSFQSLKKEEETYTDYLGAMGTEMGLDWDLELHGVSKENVLSDIRHMIGMSPEGKEKPYTRKGKKFFKPNRNTWAGPNEGLDILSSECFGYIHKYEIANKPFYSLTKEGLDWAGRQMGIKIQNIK